MGEHTRAEWRLFRPSWIDSERGRVYARAMLRPAVVILLLATAVMAVPLRVATFNIETHRNEDGWPDYALDAPGTVDFDSVAAILARIDADVVALQEVHTSDINEGDLDALGTLLGLPYRFEGSNSGNFDTSLRVAFLSRYPFVSTTSILSPPGAKEISRHSPAVVVDVPGTDNDPLLISAHLKSGTLTRDRFRRAIEMRRLAAHLSTSGFGASDNFIILGDFNPSGIDRSFDELPSGLPGSYVLGSDVGFPVSYSTNMLSYFGSPMPTLLDPRQLDGDDATYDFGQTLDLIMVSPGLAGRPHATEIYNSVLDVSNGDGLPKSGSPLAAGTSADASDHFAVFGDFQLDQDPFNLALAASAASISEGGPDGSLTLTVTLAEPAADAVTVMFSSDDTAAVPVDASVSIPMGGTTSSTAVSTSRNFLFDGTRTVTFTATATGYAPAEVEVQLLDADAGYAISQPGGVIVEHFDGFGGAHDPAPWSGGGVPWLGADDGSSASPGARAYGAGGEDAVGFVSDGSGMVLETTCTNATAVPLTILDVSYEAEQWRSSFGGAADRIEVELETGAGVVPIPLLTFEARTDLPDGPVAGGMPTQRSARIQGLSIPPGGDFILRFEFVPGPDSAPLPEDVFINEFHYDNNSTDEGEFVEVVVGPGFAGELSAVELHLYNGSSGTPYGVVHDLAGFVGGEPTLSGHRIFSKEIEDIQNGGSGEPEGFALVVDGTVAEFISYRGSFTALGGPAVGMTSVDVGVFQGSTSTPVGERALGRTGSGTSPSDFTWVRFDYGVPHSPGSLNASQTISLPGAPSQGLAINGVSLVFVEDTDGDGLADDVDPDDDNDGLSDDDELAFGTDPLDAASRFALRVTTGVWGSELRFPGAEGVIYTIEWCDDLASWDHSTTVEGQEAELVFPLPSGEERVFARVRAGE